MIKGLETENNLPTLEVNMNLNYFSDILALLLHQSINSSLFPAP